MGQLFLSSHHTLSSHWELLKKDAGAQKKKKKNAVWTLSLMKYSSKMLLTIKMEIFALISISLQILFRKPGYTAKLK